MNEIIRTFENDIFNLAVKLENGEWVFDAERVAISLGISTVAKSGNECARWTRVNEYLGSFRPQLGEIKKGDFIPEPAVYKLAFKASNEIAEKFQDWLAIKVLPQLRETGEYKINKELLSDDNLEKLKMEQLQLEFTMNRLKVSKTSEVKMLRDFNTSMGLSTVYLPDYTDEKAGRSATELLKKFNIPMSTVKFNKLMLEHEFLKEETRTSTNRQGFKRYKSLTNKGLKYGKNKASTHGSEKETQPLYYEDTFIELVNILAPLKEVI